MGEPTSIKAKVFMPGKRTGRFQMPLNLETIISWIKMEGFDEYTTQGLIDLASRYPTQALPSFRRNINLMIERVRKKRKQETSGEAKEIKEVNAAKAGKEENGTKED